MWPLRRSGSSKRVDLAVVRSHLTRSAVNVNVAPALQAPTIFLRSYGVSSLLYCRFPLIIPSGVRGGMVGVCKMGSNMLNATKIAF
jgi:hypothetical protein